MLAIYILTNKVEVHSSNLEQFYAEFSTAGSRFKLFINCCHFRMVRTVFCILKSINNFN